MAQRTTLPLPVVGEWVPMTFEEFLDWAPDEGQAEWVDGKGVVYVANVPRHGRFLEFLARLIGTYLENHDLGELFTQTVLLRLPTRPSGREPDLMVILADHRDRVGARWVEGPADLVIELVSDDSARRDRFDKLGEYEAEGVREYLLIDARLGRDEFAFYRLNESGRYEPVSPDAAGRYHSTVLSGFWFDPAWLRSDPLPKVARVLALIEAGQGDNTSATPKGMPE